MTCKIEINIATLNKNELHDLSASAVWKIVRRICSSVLNYKSVSEKKKVWKWCEVLSRIADEQIIQRVVKNVC